MKVVYTFICFLLIFYTGAQKKDTLAVYTNAQLAEKGFTLPSNVYAETLLRRNTSDSVKAEALYILAGSSSINLGDFSLAVKYHEKSLALAKKSGYKKYIFSNMNDICLNYIMMGKNEKALSTLAELKKYRNDPDYEMNTDEADIHFLMGDFEKSSWLDRQKLADTKKELAKTHLKKQQKEWLTKRCFWLCQSLVSDYNYQKKLDSADFYMQESKKYDINNFFKSGAVWSNEVFSYILRRQPDAALALIQKQQNRITKSKPYIYRSLYYKALCYQMKGDNRKALVFAEEAIKYKAPSFSYQNYELECYKIASAAAKKIGDQEKMIFYSQKYIENSNKINYNAKSAFISKLYNQDIQEQSQENTNSRLLLLFWSVTIIFSLSLFFLWRLLRIKAEKKKFLTLIDNLKSQKLSQAIILEDVTTYLSSDISIDSTEQSVDINYVSETVAEEKGRKNISVDTEKEIIRRLEIFEKKKHYLSPDVSLGKLALDFKTNTTYITYVIKKYKNDNLVNYVNKLRIQYIINKMTHHTEYSNYKIEYLAKESGFSSYSTFKRIFTKQTGVDPSRFIEYVKNSDIDLY